eukprot:g866.t1
MSGLLAKHLKLKSATLVDEKAENDLNIESEDFSNDDDEGEDGYKPGGYHRVHIGDVYNNRYEVKTKLGWGHFSTVWTAFDRKRKRYVALKVQKSASHYTEAAYDEIKLLTRVNEEAGTDEVPVVRLLDHFKHDGPNGTHVCFVFEMLGENLLSLIKQYDYHGVPLPIVKQIAKQVCQGIAFLHTNCSIIHTDIKPENILISTPRQSTLRYLDKSIPLATGPDLYKEESDDDWNATKEVDGDQSHQVVEQEPTKPVQPIPATSAGILAMLKDKSITMSKSKRKKLKKQLKKLQELEATRSESQLNVNDKNSEAVVVSAVETSVASNVNIESLSIQAPVDDTASSVPVVGTTEKEKEVIELENTIDVTVNGEAKEDDDEIKNESGKHQGVENENTNDGEDGVCSRRPSDRDLSRHSRTDGCSHFFIMHQTGDTSLEVLVNSEMRVVSFNDEHLAHVYLEELRHHIDDSTNSSSAEMFVCPIDDDLWRSCECFGLQEFSTLNGTEGIVNNSSSGEELIEKDVSATDRSKKHNQKRVAVELGGDDLEEDMRLNLTDPTDPVWIEATEDALLALRNTAAFHAFERENFRSERETCVTKNSNVNVNKKEDDHILAPPIPPSQTETVPPVPPTSSLVESNTTSLDIVPPLPPPPGKSNNENMVADDLQGREGTTTPVLEAISQFAWNYPPREHIFRLIIVAPMEVMRKSFETVEMRRILVAEKLIKLEEDTGAASRDMSAELMTMLENSVDNSADYIDFDDPNYVPDDWHFKCTFEGKSSLLMIRYHDTEMDSLIANSFHRIAKLATTPSCSSSAMASEQGDPKLWSLRFDARQIMGVFTALENQCSGLAMFKVPQQTLSLLPLAHDECRVPRSVRSDNAVVMASIIPAGSPAQRLLCDIKHRFGLWAERLAGGHLGVATKLDDGRELKCKVVDLGNACWIDRHFSDDIQTRQYRCPEVILGADYCTPADMWSVACLIFELATGDLLFDPQGGETYSRDDDHLAQCLELLGRCPRHVAVMGKNAKTFFNRKGELRNIRKLRYWPLESVLREKYEFAEEEAKPMADFLTRCLTYSAKKRATAEECCNHPWLNS